MGTSVGGPADALKALLVPLKMRLADWARELTWRDLLGVHHPQCAGVVGVAAVDHAAGGRNCRVGEAADGEGEGEERDNAGGDSSLRTILSFE